MPKASGDKPQARQAVLGSFRRLPVTAGNAQATNRLNRGRGVCLRLVGV